MPGEKKFSYRLGMHVKNDIKFLINIIHDRRKTRRGSRHFSYSISQVRRLINAEAYAKDMAYAGRLAIIAGGLGEFHPCRTIVLGPN